MLFQVSEFLEPIGMFHRNFPWARAPVSISVETFPKASIPGTELDVPRLAAPRGPARGRARANLRDLTYRSSSTIAAAPWRVCAVNRRARYTNILNTLLILYAAPAIRLASTPPACEGHAVHARAGRRR